MDVDNEMKEGHWFLTLNGRRKLLIEIVKWIEMNGEVLKAVTSKHTEMDVEDEMKADSDVFAGWITFVSPSHRS